MVVGNRALEEFRERLLRWDELCAQLRELYYKYLDIAAFRSDKCYFPGRKYERSLGRSYNIDDLTLMWAYIANTAPFCGSFARTMSKIEGDVMHLAIRSFERNGGMVNRRKPNKSRPNNIITTISLNTPIYAYLALLENKLYVIWGEFDELSDDKVLRSIEIEKRIIELIEEENYEAGATLEYNGFEQFSVDSEYKRLWLEVPLPEDVSKLLGGRDKAPVALFRNLGWLLSDDMRKLIRHGSTTPGQTTSRIFDWVALATYATKMGGTDKPLIFKLAVYTISETKKGKKPVIVVYPIGTTAKLIKDVYERFGIILDEPKMVLARGYNILSVLREKAFVTEKGRRVVGNVAAWIAFSNTLDTLIAGDGSIRPYRLAISIKLARSTEVYREILGRPLKGKYMVILRDWYMRLLLPTPVIPSFEKMTKLYEALVNYPAGALVSVDGAKFLLNHKLPGLFVIGKRKGEPLYEMINRVGLKAYIKGKYLFVTYESLKRLAHGDAQVQFLSELEKAIAKSEIEAREVKLEIVKKTLEKIAKMAKISVAKSSNKYIVIIYPHDRSKAEEIKQLLTSVGIRAFVFKRKREVRISEQKSVEIIRSVMPQIFSKIAPLRSHTTVRRLDS